MLNHETPTWTESLWCIIFLRQVFRVRCPWMFEILSINTFHELTTETMCHGWGQGGTEILINYNDDNCIFLFHLMFHLSCFVTLSHSCQEFFTVTQCDIGLCVLVKIQACLYLLTIFAWLQGIKVFLEILTGICRHVI